MKETLKAKEMFELYYSMGSDRSLDALRKKLVSEMSQNEPEKIPSLPTLKRWSKNFNWQERVEQRDMDNAKRLEKKTNTTVVNEKANYRKIIKEAFDIFKENLRNGEVEIKTVQDMERLAKLDLLIMGEATERGENTQEHAFTDESIKKAYETLYGETK